jgi:D-arabinose 1-dehydrogenase-like Zn-dependent alcohol dehydrogenase
LRPADVVVEVAGAVLGRAAEVSGVVVEVGEAAREWLGRRVVVPRILPCGDCDHCRRGRVAACPGRLVREELAATQAVPARWLTSVDPPLWPEGAELWQLAALADAALAPYTALSRAGVGPSDRVVIVGSDARARFAAAIVAAKGAKLVAFDDADAHKGGAIVVATRPRDWPRALAGVAPGSTIALLDGDGDGARAADGAGGGAVPLATDWPALVSAEAHVMGVVGGHPDLLPELCALVVRGQIALGDAVRRVSFADAAAARAAYLADGGPLPIATPA